MLKHNLNRGRQYCNISVVENTDQPMIIDGKEVDESTIEYDMQDYGDLIAPISDAKFIDGTDLTDRPTGGLGKFHLVRRMGDDRLQSETGRIRRTTCGRRQRVRTNRSTEAKAFTGMKPNKFDIKQPLGGKPYEYTLKDAIEIEPGTIRSE